MTLEYFSAFYFIYPALIVCLFFALYFILRHKTKRTQYWVLFGILALNFCLHFLKLAFSPYVEDLPESIRKVTFENICAVSTLVFPFFMLSKKKYLLDYMFYIGVISGVASMFAPLNVIGLGVGEFETIRFYICHGSLWICPLLMVVLGVHKPDYHRIPVVLLLYMGCLCLILINEVLLMVIGWVSPDEDWTGTLWEYFLSVEVRNSGFVFGVPESFEKVGAFILALVPEIFKPGKYIDTYMPVLWELFPVIVYGIPVAFLMSLYWERGHVKSDLSRLSAKVQKFAKRARICRKNSVFVRRAHRPGRATRCRYKNGHVTQRRTLKT